MIAELSPAARRQGIKKALAVCILSSVVFCLAVLGFNLVLGRSGSESLPFALGSFAGAIYLWCLWGWLRGRRQAGGVLLDCSSSQSRRKGLTSASWTFVCGLAMILLPSGGASDIPGWLLMFHAVFMALLAFSPVQIREHGLWSGMSLLRWDKIESYWWDGSSTLMLVAKNRRWFNNGAVLVPPELQEPVDRLLGTLMPGIGSYPMRRNR